MAVLVAQVTTIQVNLVPNFTTFFTLAFLEARPFFYSLAGFD